MKKKWNGLAILGVVLLANLGLPKPVFGIGVKSFCDSSGNPTSTPDVTNVRVYTALGCVPAEIDKFVMWLLPKMFGVAGGIAFLLMVYGFIVVSTSGGDPKKVAGGQETITSAVTGLLLSIFALFILRLIAVDILKIPGF